MESGNVVLVLFSALLKSVFKIIFFCKPIILVTKHKLVGNIKATNFDGHPSVHLQIIELYNSKAVKPANFVNKTPNPFGLG